MRQISLGTTRRTLRTALAGLVLISVLVGAPGLGCDGEAANAFRDAATGPIGEGVKGIVNGVLDGMIAAVENAGNGATEATDGTDPGDSQ